MTTEPTFNPEAPVWTPADISLADLVDSIEREESGKVAAHLNRYTGDYGLFVAERHVANWRLS